MGGLIVQKYGGTSVANADLIKGVARRIARVHDSGTQVVAVVSAMGDTTDELCDLAAGVSPRPRPSDLDALLSTGELVSSALLAIALADLGQAPVTFTGSMAGLITDNVHGKAQITDVRPDRIRTCLARGEIPIVAGFQGRTKKGKKVIPEVMIPLIGSVQELEHQKAIVKRVADSRTPSNAAPASAESCPGSSSLP